MAFDTGTQQANRTMRHLAEMLANMGLMKQRQAGYQQLEESEHRNMMTRLEEGYKKWLLQQDPIKRTMSMIADKASRGEDTSELQTSMRELLENYANAGYASVTGNIPDKKAWALISQLNEGVQSTILSGMGSGARQKESIREVEKPRQRLAGNQQILEAAGLRLREGELGVKRKQAETSAAQEAREGRGESTKEFGQWIDLIKSIRAQLDREGVIPEGMAESDLRSKIEFEGTTSKVLDAIPSRLRGQAYSALNYLQQKMIQKAPLTDAEKIYLQRISNTFKIKEEEALPSMETGRFPSQQKLSDTVDALGDREMAIRGIEARIRARTKISDPAEIRRLAQEYYDARRGRTGVRGGR